MLTELQAATLQALADGPQDVALEIRGEPDHALTTDSLDGPSRGGSAVLSVREVDGEQRALVHFTEQGLPKLQKKIVAYRDEDTKSGKPRNQKLVASISHFALPTVESFWTDPSQSLPLESETARWWEAWLLNTHDTLEDLTTLLMNTLRVPRDDIGSLAATFPERAVFLVKCSLSAWETALPKLTILAEIRSPRSLVEKWNSECKPYQQAEAAKALASSVVPSPTDAPRVCILDNGFAPSHPLLQKSVDHRNVHHMVAKWNDDESRQHGTQMAGLILYGKDLGELLETGRKEILAPRLEFVKVLGESHSSKRELPSAIVPAAVELAEIHGPKGPRLICLAVSSEDGDAHQGTPSAYSAALDQHAAESLNGEDWRLYVTSAGNVRDHGDSYSYPHSNLEDFGIEDPSQSWNVLTVGAFTELSEIEEDDSDYGDYVPVAGFGQLAPTSRTSCMWEKTLALKPDIVMEGGNLGQLGSRPFRIPVAPLSLLTTDLSEDGALFGEFHSTSAATALACNFASRLLVEYPTLRPETVRGLVVHSADWTEQMIHQVPGTKKGDLLQRTRVFGFGTPSWEKACWSMNNQVSLIHEGQLQPCRKIREKAKDGKWGNKFQPQCIFVDLPWPTEVLQELSAVEIQIRVTLSYYIEPSPGSLGHSSKFRYASHGLRFAMRGADETNGAFLKRISTAAWTKEEKDPKNEAAPKPSTADPDNDKWDFGGKNRTNGSLHRDTWRGSAADAANCGKIAIFPAIGWWKERRHLKRTEKMARFSLLVTIEGPEVTQDLYAMIQGNIAATTEVMSAPEIKI